ncbi:MAG: exodeoxyribonuclease V subunit beta [Betaproteobacteria bacterium]
MTARILDTDAVLTFPLEGAQLIEASAGTGKTYTIANLYLRHVIAGRGIGDILVVTFTRAATDELRGRIRLRLFEAQSALEQAGTAGAPAGDDFLQALVASIPEGQDLQTTLQRLRLAVRAMDEAAIFTIHGFCQRALTEFAFSSGQQFDLDVVPSDRDLWDEAVADWWRRTAYPLGGAALALFGGSLCSLGDFRKWLAPLLRAHAGRLVPAVEPLAALLESVADLTGMLPALEERWRTDGSRISELLRTSRGISRDRKGLYHLTTLDAHLATVDRFFRDRPTPLPPESLEVLAASRVAEALLRRPTDPALNDPVFDAFGAFLDRRAALERKVLAAALADAATAAAEGVRRAKQRARILSYDDLLVEMRHALEAPGENPLATAVRKQFPVAMIDEFQDTDPVQYDIFRRIYLDQPGLCLTMIGDPKQAIYSFRGGDIFTYMQAKADIGSRGLYTLTTNWRSTPEVIQAVNAVFCRRPTDAFVYGEAIPFLPAQPSPRQPGALVDNGAARPALTLWTVPEDRKSGGSAKSKSKDEVSKLAHAAVANEIARLIAGGQTGRICLGNRPLAPRDIAVLVRTGDEAAALRAVLARRGVSAVAVGREGVFAAGEASDLEALLRAVANPRDRNLARLALALPLLGHDYPAIDRICQDEAAWTAWIARLLRLQDTWQRRGFMPMFQQLLRDLDIPRSLGGGYRAARSLTNLLHLGELLQQSPQARHGMDALIAWLHGQRRTPGDAEESELRLESDDAVVQIVTVHASKGLEYPVCFIPYLWSSRQRNADKELVRCHRDGGTILDAGSGDIERHKHLAEQERLAEDTRLAYVALTRAASAIYLVWGRAGSGAGHAGTTALAYLLHPTQSGQQLAQEAPDAFRNLDNLDADLRQLENSAGDTLVVTPLPDAAGELPAPPAETPPALQPRPFRGTVASSWRVASFSSLTRNAPLPGGAVRDPATADAAARLPAGAGMGSYLHLLLERLDFQGDIPTQVLRHSATIAARFDLDHDRWGGPVADLIARAVNTPLDTAGLRLADIGPDRRLNELAFDFATAAVDLGRLHDIRQALAGTALRGLDSQAFEGLVTGVIDLVFEAGGRFHIADYKSNLLGNRSTDYTPDRLQDAMLAHHYDLQALLYALALHRYLRQRIRGYSYDQHFGHIHYLFLRGMDPGTGPRQGIFTLRPDAALIDTLDRQVFHHDGGGQP